MAKDPAFLFYSSDFIVGTQTMNWEDRGKYITILALMHQQGRMDEETIRFLVGSFSDKLISKFQKDENGLYYNVRLEEEIEKRSNFVDSRRINGSKGGRPKAIDKPNGKPQAKPEKNLSEDVNEDENKDDTEDLKSIPTIENFLNHAFEKASKVNLEVDEQKLRLKYETWKENGWRTLGDKSRKISNWKSTLNNSLLYLQKEKSSDKKESGTVESIRQRLIDIGAYD